MLASLCAAALVVAIANSANAPTSVVDGVVAEVNAIWGVSGIRIVSSGDQLVQAASVIIDLVSLRGVGDRDRNMPLAWVTFNGATPDSRIYVSYANARDLLQQSSSIVGNPATLPPARRDTLLGRAMGRALAHELGHYIFASKMHTSTGLMQRTLSGTDLFSVGRGSVTLTSKQRAIVASRVDAIRAVPCQ